MVGSRRQASDPKTGRLLVYTQRGKWNCALSNSMTAMRSLPSRSPSSKANAGGAVSVLPCFALLCPGSAAAIRLRSASADALASAMCTTPVGPRRSLRHAGRGNDTLGRRNRVVVGHGFQIKNGKSVRCEPKKRLGTVINCVYCENTIDFVKSR